jgi:hypothetical protein
MLKTSLIILLLIPFLSFCQEKNAVRFSIDSVVRNIDTLSKAKGRSYFKEKTMNNKKIKEKWRYFDNKKNSFISIEYKIDSTAYTEEYYLQNSSLIHASEQEIWYNPSLGANEYTAWSGGFYFSKQKLIDHVTLGHGKSETEDWDPEKEILQRLKKRKAEVALLK